jgi:CHAT domain-containing protein/tetratricopeptide (TPR) repeat protein
VSPDADPGEEAVRSFDLGSTLRRSGRAAESLPPLQKALEIFDRLGEARPWAAVENEIGCALRDVGRPMEAAERFANAVQTLRQGQPTSASQGALMLALANLGRALRELDRYEQALTALHEAHAIAQEPEHRWQQGHVLNAIGSVYRDLHLVDEAKELYAQALDAFRTQEDEPGEAQASNNLGVVAVDSGRPHDAARWFALALEHYERLGDARRQALARSNLGRALAERGDLETAIPQLESAARDLADMRAAAEAAAACASLGGVYAKVQRYEAAEGAYREARDLFAEVGNLVGQATMDGSIAGMLIQQDRDAQGLALLRHAIDELEHGYDTVHSDDLRAQLVASTSRLHVLHARLMAGEERPLAVLEAVEVGRARALRLSASRGAGSAAESAARAALTRELMLIDRAVTEAPGADSIALDGLRARQRELRLRLRAADALGDVLAAEPDPLAVADLRRRLATAGEVLLHYTLSGDTGFLVAMRDDAVQLHEIKEPERLPQLITELREAIAKRAHALPHVADLYTTLVEPAASFLDGRDLLVVPDGPLFELPWALLHPALEDSRRGRPLVCDHAIRIAPSAAWAFNRDEQPQPEERESRRDLLAVAVPLTPRRRGRAARESAVESERVALRSRALGELPGAVHEVERVAEACGVSTADPASVRIGDEATKPAVEALLFASGGYRWVHLACHGLLDRDHPEYSGLLLHPTGDGDPCLRAFEIAGRRIDCDLVVLSACNTGVGRYVAGEGLMGIARAFLAAGAPSVCVSTWPVADVSAPELMAAFYAELSRGEFPARALAAAQRAQLGSKFAHPFFWAPFAVVGRSPSRSPDANPPP